MRPDNSRGSDGDWRPSSHDTVPDVLYSLVTDEGTPVISTPSAPIDYDKDGAKRKDWRETDDKKHSSSPGAYLVDESGETPIVTDKTANCHGTTFGGGDYYIDVGGVPDILRDNYLRVDFTKNQKARVCDIIVWSGGARHSATIVEVDAKGKPTMVIGKNGDLGRLWAHPPDDYGSDWDVHGKRNPPEPPAKEVDDLRKAYDDAKKASDDDPKNDALRKKAHLAAYRLCRRKNRLKKK